VVNLTLPAQGRLGVYVRLRGVVQTHPVDPTRTSMQLVVAQGNRPLFDRPLDAANDPRFAERILEVPTGWTDARGAPDKVALLAQPGATLVEIDCVIPFVRP
jgi:hypothetical protein